jgi:hypothetical protein
MKILVANIGSTSLKWRLFDFSNGNAERLLHKGGFERVTDYPKAIEDCLAGLKNAKAIQDESELSAVGFKTVIAKNVTGCVRLDERVLQAMADYNGLAPAHNPPYITGIKLFAQRMPKVPLIGFLKPRFINSRPKRACATPCRIPGIKSASAAGVFTARATNSSPNARRNCLAGRRGRSARGSFMSRRRDENFRRAVARDFLPSWRQFERHGNFERRVHRHEHGHEPAIRPAAKQPRRRSRCRGASLRGERRLAFQSKKRRSSFDQRIRAERFERRFQ